MSIHSDLKYMDVFRDPLWLLDNLLAKYKVIDVPTRGWNTNNAGSGSVGQYPIFLTWWTGTTADSRALAYTYLYLLNSGDTYYTRLDFGKRLIWEFTLDRHDTADSAHVGRVQIKTVNTEGALSDVGLGLEIDNLDVYGEAYGTARGTVHLTTLTLGQLKRFRIVLIPGSKVEFYTLEASGWVKRGELTGDYVPTGAAICYMVLSAINPGVTSSMSFDIANIRIIQEW